jgi:hypothetical protein
MLQQVVSARSMNESPEDSEDEIHCRENSSTLKRTCSKCQATCDMHGRLRDAKEDVAVFANCPLPMHHSRAQQILRFEESIEGVSEEDRNNVPKVAEVEGSRRMTTRG